METARVKYLVSEYRLAKKRLDEIKGIYEGAQVSFEITEDLEKELENELQKAKDSIKPLLTKYWQDIKNTCFVNDKDRVTKKDVEKAQSEFLEKNEKIITYYEKKIKIIKRLLGARLIQILENYEEKNILMGEEGSSKKRFYGLQEEDEEREEKTNKQRKNEIGFDKL